MAVWFACPLAKPGGVGIARAQAPATEIVLRSFGRPNGAPPSPLIRDEAGNIYGTTNQVGAGVVFRPDALGQEKILYNFTGGADGGTICGRDRDSGRQALPDCFERRDEWWRRGIQTLTLQGPRFVGRWMTRDRIGAIVAMASRFRVR